MSTAGEELPLMPLVDVHDWGPTEPDEEAVLGRLFEFEPRGRPGVFAFRVGSLVPNTVAASLNEAQKWIGTRGRPNMFTREYASRHGSEFLASAWCDMFQTYVAHHAPALSMIPKGDRAYTPWHAGDFDAMGQAYAGSAGNIIRFAKPGSVIFFDWNGSNSADAVDHVGIVVHNLGDGRLVTCEGNTSDMVALRTRGSDVIAVVGVPVYATEIVTPKPVGDAWPYGPGTFMRKGWIHSAGVMKVQRFLDATDYRPRLLIDGNFGSKTEAAVRWYQKKNKIAVDGVVGPQTWSRMFG
jgi:peptidoglycan hydrolase-like protein with peptidoglycan-binding domain